jgi:oxygen-independent coproporphyrinogen III oxidase
MKEETAGILQSIYIGGGTPSLLSDNCFVQLFRCLKDNYNFSSDIEITVEANPGTIDGSKTDAILSLGVNRLSLGVQSFNDNELKTLGRIHDSEDAFRSIRAIKIAGMINFSIDLMYGIPGQTMDSWQDSISKAVRLSPAHISTYELTPEEHTPFFKLLETHMVRIPDEELVLEMYNYAIDYLAGSGYEHYEISNFALPGFRCIHNLNYWDRGEYIGAGAGAHSFTDKRRSRNIRDINAYIDKTNKGIAPEVESIKLTPEEALKEFIFLGLRKTEGISIPKSKEIGLNILNVSDELFNEGLFEIAGDHLRLTRKGIFVSNTVFLKLFEKLGL